MANDVAGLAEEAEGGAEFVLSTEPVVPENRRADSTASEDYENLGELPSSYGGA